MLCLSYLELALRYRLLAADTRSSLATAVMAHLHAQKNTYSSFDFSCYMLLVRTRIGKLVLTVPEQLPSFTDATEICKETDHVLMLVQMEALICNADPFFVYLMWYAVSGTKHAVSNK